MGRRKEDNLIPKTSDQDREEAKRNGRKGGVESGKARRRKKAMRECFELMMSMKAPEKVTNTFKKQGMNVPDDLTTYEALTFSMMMKAISGDARMAALIMEVMGEKYSDKLKEREIDLKEKELKQGNQDAINRLDEILRGLKNAAENDEETE